MNQNQCQTDHVSISGHSLFLKEDLNCPLNAQLFVEQLQHLKSFHFHLHLSMAWISSQMPCLCSMALSCCKIIFLSCRIPDFNNEIGECLSHNPRRPNCTCYLWQKQRWKSERWPKIQSQHHRCCDQHHTTAPHNYNLHIKWWRTLSLDVNDDKQFQMTPLVNLKILLATVRASPSSSVTVSCDDHLISQPNKQELIPGSLWSSRHNNGLWLAE